MTWIQVVVTLAGLLAIGWVNYYFFATNAPAVVASVPESGPQEVTVEVHGGYSPAAIKVKVGRPVRLKFHRTDTGSCTEEVVLGDFGIRRFLPPGETTAVEFTPQVPGTYEFACGMGMVRGKLIVD
jgi:plastocyanin domain-containing protein